MLLWGGGAVGGVPWPTSVTSACRTNSPSPSSAGLPGHPSGHHWLDRIQIQIRSAFGLRSIWVEPSCGSASGSGSAAESGLRLLIENCIWLRINTPTAPNQPDPEGSISWNVLEPDAICICVQILYPRSQHGPSDQVTNQGSSQDLHRAKGAGLDLRSACASSGRLIWLQVWTSDRDPRSRSRVALHPNAAHGFASVLASPQLLKEAPTFQQKAPRRPGGVLAAPTKGRMLCTHVLPPLYDRLAKENETTCWASPPQEMEKRKEGGGGVEGLLFGGGGVTLHGSPTPFYPDPP